MAAWHVDLFLDFDWIFAHGGQSPEPKSRSRTVDGKGRPVEYLVYGEGEDINHLRIIIEAATDEDAQAIVNENIVFWREATTVTSVLTTSHYTAAATLGANSSGHMVWVGQGGAEVPFMQLTLQMAKPVAANYEAAAMSLANWPPDMAIHLHFLAKFLNPNLPADIRWLQGYRFLEWHFERGATKLAANPAWRAFLVLHGSSFDALKRAEQTRYGFIEEVRALMAHAMLADRVSAEETAKMQSSTTNTFAALEGLILAVLNGLAPEGVQFMPKPPLEPPN